MKRKRDGFNYVVFDYLLYPPIRHFVKELSFLISRHQHSTILFISLGFFQTVYINFLPFIRGTGRELCLPSSVYIDKSKNILKK